MLSSILSVVRSKSSQPQKQANKRMSEHLSTYVDNLRNIFRSGRTKNVTFRRRQLYGLLRMLQEHEQDLLEALTNDFKRGRMETIFIELQSSKDLLRSLIDNFTSWSRPRDPESGKPLYNLLDTLCIKRQAHGVVLIMASWRLPLADALQPFAGAVANGNCVLLVLNKRAPHTAHLLETLLPNYVNRECYQIILIDHDEDMVRLVLDEGVDYVHFEGSKSLATKILENVSLTLRTPISWTLTDAGIKNVVYIDKTADLRKTIRRILWSKLGNCGQTRWAPQWVLCSADVRDVLLKICPGVLEEFYGPGSLKECPDYCRLIDEVAVRQLVDVMHGASVLFGGDYDIGDKYFAPTILTDASEDVDICGPVLVLALAENVYVAANYLAKRFWKLDGLYIFSNIQQEIDYLIDSTLSRTVYVNDCPGAGGAREEASFSEEGDAQVGPPGGLASFSRQRACVYKEFTAWGERVSALRYPPFEAGKLRRLRCCFTKGGCNVSLGPLVLFFALGIVVTVTYYEYVKRKNR